MNAKAIMIQHWKCQLCGKEFEKRQPADECCLDGNT